MQVRITMKNARGDTTDSWIARSDSNDPQVVYLHSDLGMKVTTITTALISGSTVIYEKIDDNA